MSSLYATEWILVPLASTFRGLANGRSFSAPITPHDDHKREGCQSILTSLIKDWLSPHTRQLQESASFLPCIDKIPCIGRESWEGGGGYGNRFEFHYQISHATPISQEPTRDTQSHQAASARRQKAVICRLCEEDTELNTKCPRSRALLFRRIRNSEHTFHRTHLSYYCIMI